MDLDTMLPPLLSPRPFLSSLPQSSSQRLPPHPPPHLLVSSLPTPAIVPTDDEDDEEMYHEPQGTEPQWTLRQVKSTPRPIHGHDAGSQGPAPPQPLPRILAPPDSRDGMHIPGGGTHTPPPSNSAALHALLALLLATILLLFLQQPRIRRRLSLLTLWLTDTLSDAWKGFPVLFRPDIIALRGLRYVTVGDPEGLIEPGSLKGQTIFIAGASGGIGFEMLVECLRKGEASRVLAGVRSEARGEDVKRRIRTRVGDGKEAEQMLSRTTFVIVDFESLQSACEGAQAILDAVEQHGGGRLDAFVNTVGVGWLPPSNRQTTVDGVEWLMGINAVNPLATLLVVLAAQRKRREEVPPPKVVFFSSLSHVWLGFTPARYGNWGRVTGDQAGRAWLSRYGQSKLLQLHSLHSLSPHLSLPTPIHAINPGECNTPFVDTLCVWLVARPTPTPTTSLAHAWATIKLAYYRWQHWFNCKSLSGALWRRWCTLRPLDGANVGLGAINDSSTQGRGDVAYWCYDFWTGARQGSIGTVARDEKVRKEAWRLVRGTLLEFFAGRAEVKEEGVKEEVLDVLSRGGWGESEEEEGGSGESSSTDTVKRKDD